MNLSILQSIDSAIEHISAPVYYWLVGIIYVIYFISMFGIASIDPDYTDYLNNVVQIFIAIILIIRFNPLRKLSCTANDRVLIMSSAMFLLINDSISAILRKYFQDYIPLKSNILAN
jgi:hypothetical protein